MHEYNEYTGIQCFETSTFSYLEVARSPYDMSGTYGGIFIDYRIGNDGVLYWLSYWGQ
jgi:hypothetical protein